MTNRSGNPTMKAIFEYGPIILFFIGYSLFKERIFVVGGIEYSGFVAMTAMFIPMLSLSTLALWKLTGHVSKMQIMTLVLVIGFGGLSIWFNDERFFKMKPTLIYLLFSGILGFGLWRGTSYLESVMDRALPLEREGWMILTKRLAVFFLILAMANELIWRMLSTDAWVNFKTFGLPLAIVVFFVSQNGVFQKYGIEDESTKK